MILIATWIVAGLFAGWAATMAMGRTAHGLLRDMIVGVPAALAGDALTSSHLGIGLERLNLLNKELVAAVHLQARVEKDAEADATDEAGSAAPVG